jgi:DNA-3-methyladenine glycosylase I
MDMVKKHEVERCAWAGSDELYINYHDKEWGTPVHSDLIHFEFITLEGAQAGLSWITILRKRENYREAFSGFDYEKIAKYTEKDVEILMSNPGIIRNRRKIDSTIKNAQSFIEVQKEFGSFDKYIWSFTKGKTIVGNWEKLSDVPTSTELSDNISKDLKKRGFNFVGTTIIYSYLQAVGIVNDHVESCFRNKR